jgi:hypothetical protein
MQIPKTSPAALENEHHIALSQTVQNMMEKNITKQTLHATKTIHKII